MSFLDNPYAYPEKSGLTIVGEIDWSSGYYEFDLTVVWADANDQLYYADDSGCSCPSPFENMSFADLTPCTFFELVEHLENRASTEDPAEYSEDTLINLIAKARMVGSSW